MQTIKYPQKNNWNTILSRPTIELEEMEEVVNQIFKEIKADGDAALRKYTWFYDRVKIDKLSVSQAEIDDSEQFISDELKNAIQVAAQNIEKFHKAQMPESRTIETTEGVTCWRKFTPIDKVGLYIPGGSAPLFSTVLMLGIPARIANCQEVVLCTPPDKKGKINPAILYACKLVGISKVFRIGGIQAIGAMALGTESIPGVYKIFGPGNQFVTAAKQTASKLGIAIDMPAGPSEVLVMADESAVPEFVAADLLSQAEHGPDSQVILLSWNEALVEKVQVELAKQLKNLSREAIATKALNNSKIILVKSAEEALEISNLYGPEHLIVSVKNEDEILNSIQNAGSVFIGNYTPESAGDYASGTNHTLPTNGYAKSYSGVGLGSFMKSITFQKITRKGLENLGPSIEIMAEAEQLAAHKNAVSIRLNRTC
ncbi:histidinol dehydrogenase [Ancylomarina euxinus]|uniref:Histidinol dehydrogenase n=1 Tax=Ancylomarina euxinus TaxID=2283627 RepID=A0A425Y417_9BACT|nr:histidinol dehydrogenase [Ancylomarina euxinus]MCZ4694546.1 histidinol dehydrogenase [Ancylomarina euxinus]MUP14089.1 histidinol dehydrogenase [Ancylomarina euxinus]RRG22947.1 histidinol dehydrogenase [Ancylomarina euxinus]